VPEEAFRLGDIFKKQGRAVMKMFTAQTRLVSLLGLFVILWSTAYAQITPSADYYTNTVDPTTNYGAKTLLDVDGASQITYIQFNLASIPVTASVSQATLKLYVNSVTTAGSFNVDYINSAWAENTIDSSNAPPLGTTIASNVDVTTADKNQYILINVTSAVQAWLSGSETNNGIALVANSTFNATFDSKENTTTSHAPELDIAFAGGEGTITGVTTASGSGLTGGGTSGTLDLSLTHACAAKQVLQWSGSSWACSAAETGTITGVTAGTALTGGGTGGNVTLNLDTTQVPVLAANNYFSGNNLFEPFNADAIDAYTAWPGKTALVGVQSATSGGSYGVWARTSDPTGAGVKGINAAASAGVGVYGSSNGTGVYGTSSLPYGVGVAGQRESISSTGKNLTSIYQRLGVGVWGDAGSNNDSGGFLAGVIGSVDDGAAAMFANNSSNGDDTVLIWSFNKASDPLYVEGTNGYCYVDATGDLNCSGSKNAVVPIDGGARTVAMSAIESPVNWFEDAGSAQLVNGAAIVNLDRDFIQTVNTEMDYKVFPVPNGDCKGLYVTNKTAASFEVRELGSGTSNVAFDYRIMAVRRNYESVRFADHTHDLDSMKLMQEQAKTLSAKPASPDRIEAPKWLPAKRLP
jgi:hypothetical protein